MNLLRVRALNNQKWELGRSAKEASRKQAVSSCWSSLVYPSCSFCWNPSCRNQLVVNYVQSSSDWGGHSSCCINTPLGSLAIKHASKINLDFRLPDTTRGLTNRVFFVNYDIEEAHTSTEACMHEATCLRLRHDLSNTDSTVKSRTGYLLGYCDTTREFSYS